MTVYPYYIYRCKMLDLFLKSLGEGFPEIINSYNKKLNSNNLKQKIKAMYAGNYKAYQEINDSLYDCALAFTDASIGTESTTDFAEEQASDKYFYSFRDLFLKFFEYDNDFLYESVEDTVAYFIAKLFYSNMSSDDYKTVSQNTKFEEETRKQLSDKLGWQSEKEHEEFIEWQIRCFRPEYSSSLSDVRFNKKNNKTFYKWVIDEFKKGISSKEIYNEVLEIVFKGENGINKTFEKLKREPGRRRWSSFVELFSNEQKKSNLWKILNKDAQYLATYEIFQSRMFVAFFLENLCDELPKFVGDENAQELIKIITGDVSRKKPEDFLIENHEEKTMAMLETFKAAWETPLTSEKDILSILQNFDKDCPATETFKAYFSIYHESLRRNLTENQIHEAFDLCMENSIYFEGYEMHDYLRSIKQGNIYE